MREYGAIPLEEEEEEGGSIIQADSEEASAIAQPFFLPVSKHTEKYKQLKSSHI